MSQNIKTAEPIIYQVEIRKDAIDELQRQLQEEEPQKHKKIILEYPVVYIHNCEDAAKYDVYIGESYNIIKRTKQHLLASEDARNWQSILKRKESRLFVIGHEHFNKSLTMDVENRLMLYMSSLQNVRRVHNKRKNQQNMYYTCEEFENIFKGIWEALGNENNELFPTEKIIHESAIYKASPLHKLTEEQEEAKRKILEKIHKALHKEIKGQTIFISGEAGTGKTVLNSSLFYDLCALQKENNLENIKCHLLVNHDQQLVVYKQIAEKLNLENKEGNAVCKPTNFITTHSEDEPVDVVLIDEAHLLWTQGKQAYRGKNQLEDIQKRARVVIVMFDRNQMLRTEQYWEAELIDRLEEEARLKNNYIRLVKQLRIRAAEATIHWINQFTKNQKIEKIPVDDNYQIRIMDTPEELEAAIYEKAEKEETGLSRMIATFDWEYKDKDKESRRMQKYYEVSIGNWKKPWNLQIEASPESKRGNKQLAWAEQKHTIGEIGSTFTIQGFDLNYAGVILGPSVKYRKGEIVFDPSCSKNQNATKARTLQNGTKQKFGEQLIKNEVNVLMTRGVDGLFIYAYDMELREALKNALCE